MPTIIGAIFFCSGLYCFLFKEDGLLGLLVISSIFEASSAINIGERGVQPYYLVAGFILARAMVKYAFGIRPRLAIPKLGWLLTFGFIGVTSAFLLPLIFAGVPVYDPKVGIDPGLFFRPGLAFGLNNLGQAGFLALQVATACAIPAIAFSPKSTYRAYICAFYILVGFISAESLCQLAGIPFPYSLILNNPGYALWDPSLISFGARIPGTFAEPSVAGGFLVLFSVGFIAEYLEGKGSAVRVLIALIASGAVASSGSLLTLCIAIVFLLFRYSPIRFPGNINVRRAQRIGLIALLLITPLVGVLLASPGYRQTLILLTVAKGDTASFFNRTTADLYALHLLAVSHGIGVGLGSSRASSILTTLLSNVGVAGVIAFGVFYLGLFAKVPSEYAWLRWAAYGLLINMCIGIADVTMPLLWVPILLAIQYSTKTISGPGMVKARRGLPSGIDRSMAAGAITERRLPIAPA